MSVLKTIQRERTNAIIVTTHNFEPGYVHGNNWRVVAITNDGPVELYEGDGRIGATLLKDLVQEYKTDDNEISIEGRYDWSPSLYDWAWNREYEIGEYWNVVLSKGLSLNWTT